MRDVEAMVERLVQCGVELRPDFSLDDMIEEWEDAVGADLDDPLAVLCALGGERGAVNVFHFDAECIEDHGDYARIAQRMSEMARGDLPLADVSDTVDIENGLATLTFTLDGERHEWQCQVEDDWADPAIFSRFAALLEARETGRRFIQIDTGGQDCVLGCFSDAERGRLARETGRTVDWLR